MFARSIRARFQWWLAFLLVALLSGFGITAYQLHRTNRFNQIDQELERRVSALSGDLRPPLPFGQFAKRPPFDRGPGPPRPRSTAPDRPPQGGPAEPGFGPPQAGLPGARFERREIQLSPRTLSLFDENETNGFYYALWAPDEALIRRSTNAPPALASPGRRGVVSGMHWRTSAHTREAYQITGMGDCVLAGLPLTAERAALRRFGGWLVAAGGAVLAFGLGGGWWLATRALRPVEAISATARRIAAGDLAERINVAETDSELGRLAAVLNSTFARLEAAFAQQRQFTADASHELRTPLTVLISEAQTALARQRSAPEYRETVEACLDAAQRMRRLTQSLLELARFDAGQETLERLPVDLAECARLGLEFVRPLADQRGLRILADLAPAETLGDGDRLGQVVTNLLTNAVFYNRDQGEIRLTTRVENDGAVLTVADTGSGIAAEDLPHIFQRFYRADKSRARAEGRVGLGLAICKAIVEAHGGSIQVASQPGQGSTFVVRLPR
jgi:heavy metal sensor kinase